MKFSTSWTYIVLFISLLAIGSCSKSAVSPFGTTDEEMVKDNAMVQAAFDDALKVAENMLFKNGHAMRIATAADGFSCVNVDTVVSPGLVTYTATFDNTCSNYDGRYRGGSIIAALSGTGSYNDAGAILEITFADYTINNHKLKGKISVTCVADSVHEIVVSGEDGSGYGRLVLNKGGTIKWKSKRSRRILTNDGDGILLNNTFDFDAITGNKGFDMEGETRNGIHYTGLILNPMRMDYNCFPEGFLRYPIKGTVDLSLAVKDTRTLDYGDGTCNRGAKLSIGDSFMNYTLR